MTSIQEPNPHEEILRILSLANNGYTVRRNLSPQERAAADAAVTAKAVGITYDFGARTLWDDRTYYWVPSFRTPAPS